MRISERGSQIKGVEDLCREARQLLDEGGSYRVRVLLDMILIEVAKETAKPARSSVDAPSGVRES